MPGELRVNTDQLASGGEGLLSAAGDIPMPPVPFTATGADALSTILNARTQAIEAPLIAGMPVTKADALRTAQSIIQAAAKYEGVRSKTLQTKFSRRCLRWRVPKLPVLGQRVRLVLRRVLLARVRLRRRGLRSRRVRWAR